MAFDSFCEQEYRIKNSRRYLIGALFLESVPHFFCFCEFRSFVDERIIGRKLYWGQKEDLQNEKIKQLKDSINYITIRILLNSHKVEIQWKI